jgi:hypothetical protein
MIITVDRELFLKLLAQHDQGRYYTPEAGKRLYDILTELDEQDIDYVLDLDEVCEFYKEYANATEAAMSLGYPLDNSEVTEDDCALWLDLNYRAWYYLTCVLVCSPANHRGY